MADTSNPYKATARTRKALAICATLQAHRIDHATAAALDGEGRRLVEDAAGVKRSSDATWDEALNALQAAEATVPTADPFEDVAPAGYRRASDPLADPAPDPFTGITDDVPDPSELR